MFATRLIKKVPLVLAIAANLMVAVSFFGGPRGALDMASAAQGMLLRGSAVALTEWEQGVGFNFRATSGFVTDNTGQLYGLGYADSYPTTRTPVGYSDGVTFGRGSGFEAQSNLNSGIDPRFAGAMRIINSGIQRVWRVQLPAGGNYEIRIAAGHTGLSRDCTRFQVRDTNNSTVLLECNTGTATSVDTYVDATCVTRSEADWPSLNAADTVTFTGGSPTLLNLHLGGGSCGTSFSDIAHLHIKQL